MARTLLFAALVALTVASIYATPVRTARQGRNGLLGLGRNNQPQQQGRNGLLGHGRQNHQLGMDGQQHGRNGLLRGLGGRRGHQHHDGNVDFQLGGMHVQANLHRPDLVGQIRDDVNERVRNGQTMRGRIADANAGLVLGMADHTAGMMHRANDRTRGRIEANAGLVDGIAGRARLMGDRQMARAQKGAAFARGVVDGVVDGVAGMVEGGIAARNNLRNGVLGGIAGMADRNAQRRLNGLAQQDGLIDGIDGMVHGAVERNLAYSRRGGILRNPLTTLGAAGRALRPSASAGINVHGPLGNVHLGFGQE